MKTMSKMRWSEAVTLEFIKIYLRHECLWNPSHPGYKHNNQRQIAYNDIVTEFEESTTKSLSVLEVKLKFKNLRTTYLQQVHKILEKSRPDSIYEPSLIWFQEMDKCLKYVSTNRFSSNNVQETSEVDSSSQIWVDTLDTTENINPDPLIPLTDNENELSKSDAVLNNIKTEVKTSPPAKRKKSKHHSANVIYPENTANDCPEKEDEFDIYGKYIASQLRKMNIKKALKLQLEFQCLVNEARFSEMSD